MEDIKMVHIRKAKETDRNNVALCIAEGFEKDFSILCKDKQKVADAIKTGLNMEKFYVADMKGNIVGVLAISDCNGRAARAEKASLKRHFGFFKGIIGTFVLKEEFEKQLEYPITTGYIEFVAVRKKYRRQGIAAAMLQESMLLTNYQDFVLDVTDININAIKCYTSIGFEEFKRIPEKHGKQKGFNEKIFMRYCRK
ncbi:GNAT family N-acetyltransferase [Candidatus Merdisoma sp. JLR.KK011]|uniref:GNAT family N-acetyltransferase n=1 Tax=Candidatus Merdisoma sp. JLR.KK011 TaxID=3114299 RepID=UPI002FEFF6A3